MRLSFLIDVDGKVLDSKVDRSSGFRRLDEAARAGLGLCKFKPATLNGLPVIVLGIAGAAAMFGDVQRASHPRTVSSLAHENDRVGVREHVSAVERAGLTTLREGQRVEHRTL